jgi:hypothetical protein
MQYDRAREVSRIVWHARGGGGDRTRSAVLLAASLWSAACASVELPEDARAPLRAEHAGDTTTAPSHEHASDDATSAQREHCIGRARPDPRDRDIPRQPTVIDVGQTQDLLLPDGMLAWMREHEFLEAHEGWHLVRRWDQGCRESYASADDCPSAQRLVDRGLWRADVQQGAPGDGLAFLMAHRHMVELMKETFPRHAAMFSGWTHVPRVREDPENPMPWRALSWTDNHYRGFDILEDIENYLEMFPSEDELGLFIEGGLRWTPESPLTVIPQPGAGLHGALHAQWNVPGSPAALGNQALDVQNPVFWKLHGWIDDVWERYRIAKGQKQSDRDYQDVMYDQCMEMHALEPRNRKGVKPQIPPATGNSDIDPDASGFFAKSVRPILDANCTGCHSALGGAAAGLVLGGVGVTTSEVIAGIVGVKSTNGEYDLVVSGKPDLSWLMLKASGASERVTCAGSCDRQRMPPAGTTLTAAQLATLRQWITNGATAK